MFEKLEKRSRRSIGKKLGNKPRRTCPVGSRMGWKIWDSQPRSRGSSSRPSSLNRNNIQQRKDPAMGPFFLLTLYSFQSVYKLIFDVVQLFFVGRIALW